MYTINLVNESQNLTVSNAAEMEEFIRRVYALGYSDGSNLTYKGLSPKLLGYYDQNNPKVVSDFMKYVNDLYRVPDGDLLLYRTVICDDPWFDPRVAFGLSSMIQNCYSQKGHIAASVVQLLSDGSWCIHVIVSRVNRYTGEIMMNDSVDLKRALDNWYNYRAQKQGVWY